MLFTALCLTSAVTTLIVVLAVLSYYWQCFSRSFPWERGFARWFPAQEFQWDVLSVCAFAASTSE